MTARERGQVRDDELERGRRDQADQLLAGSEPRLRPADQVREVAVREHVVAGDQRRRPPCCARSVANPTPVRGRVARSGARVGSGGVTRSI